jgi:predicted dehydrogenase
MSFSRRSLFMSTGAALGAAAFQPAPGASGGKPVRVGVVGGGFGCSFQWHLHPNAKVTAVCDIRPDRLQRLSTVFRCQTQYKSYRELLQHPELDAVALFTPAPLHAWMGLEAFKAGKHVISAVPAGMSIEECEKLIDAVKRTGLRYMMAETSYYRPEIMTCMDWAREGKFGTIFYTEAEYHHEGLLSLYFDERGFPNWRHGLPPMHYPTHCTGMVVPITGERLVEVQAIGWGDNHEVLQTNLYKNPFWNTTGFFKTSGGHSSRISVFWHVASGGGERGSFYGDRMSYIMDRPEGSPNTVATISKAGKTVIDANGYPEGDVHQEKFVQPNHWERLPESLRVKSGHGGSHTFITNEFINAIVENRHPAVNAWEATAFTVPGIVAHQSALRGGEPMKIRDYGKAPG